MADCNIRNIDSDLMARMKFAASWHRMTLKQWFMAAAESQLLRESQDNAAHASANALAQTIKAIEDAQARAKVGDHTLKGRELGHELQLEEDDEPVTVGSLNVGAPRFAVEHADNCDCFMCKPPK